MSKGLIVQTENPSTKLTLTSKFKCDICKKSQLKLISTVDRSALG